MIMISNQLWKNITRLSRVKNFNVKNFLTKSLVYTNLGLMTVHCDKLVDLKEVNQENLSHEECIKQACMISTNSATTLLTTTTTAVLDICNKYKRVLSHMVGLYHELLLTGGANADVWQTVAESQGEVDKMKAAFTELNSYMASVEKVVNSTTEVAFLAGAEYLCTVLCERLYSAQTEINRYMEEIKKLEDDFLRLEEEVAKTLKKEN